MCGAREALPRHNNVPVAKTTLEIQHRNAAAQESPLSTMALRLPPAYLRLAAPRLPTSSRPRTHLPPPETLLQRPAVSITELRCAVPLLPRLRYWFDTFCWYHRPREMGLMQPRSLCRQRPPRGADKRVAQLRSTIQGSAKDALLRGYVPMDFRSWEILPG